MPTRTPNCDRSQADLAQSVCRILIIRPNHRLGNNVMLTPLIAELENTFPGAEIEILTGGQAARKVFAGFTRVVAVHAFPNWSWSHPLQVAALIYRVRNGRYDLAIDASISSRSGRFLLGLVRSRMRLGYSWGSGWRDRCLTHAIERPATPEHMAVSAVKLLRENLPSFFSTQPVVNNIPLDLRLSATERTAARELISRVLPESPSNGQQPIVVSLYPFGTGSKNYRPDWWHQLAARVQQLSDRIRLLEIVPGDGRRRLQGATPSLYSTRIRELAAVIGETDLLISPDGGVMHLGSASGARVLGLFKTTDPAVYAPFGRDSAGIVVTEADIEAVVRRVAQMLSID